MMAFVRLIRNINSYPYINLVHNLNLMNPTFSMNEYFRLQDKKTNQILAGYYESEGEKQGSK